MNRDDILALLREFKRDCRGEYGIIEIGVFGSFARDEAGEESDVDVVIRILKPDLFTLVGIKNDLEERLHRAVDIVTYREDMNPFLKKRIDGEAVYA